jgi:Nucleotidyl transferase AbiEii toxin, Type IV TA system
MTTKSRGNSIRQKLVDLSITKEIAFPNIETAFLIERLVARLVSDSKLRKALVFKGGFVGLKIYDSPRYTVDLDALLLNVNLESTLKLTRAAAEFDLDDGSWFRFEGQIDLTTQGEYGGIRQVFRAGIGEVLKNLKKAQTVNFDLGIGDPVTPKPVHAKTPALLTGEDISWSVYPIETMIAEKLHAVVAFGNANSRSKDVHDLALFLPNADPRIVREAITKCFAFRKTDLPDSFSKALSALDTKMLKRGWASAVVSISGASEFDVSFARVVSELKRLKL